MMNICLRSPSVADVAIVDHQPATVRIIPQPAHGRQAGVLLAKTVFIRAVDLRLHEHYTRWVCSS